MQDQQEIHTAAMIWIERYGEKALEQLRQRLAELEEHGEHEAYALWMKIYDEVKKLTADKTTD